MSQSPPPGPLGPPPGTESNPQRVPLAIGLGLAAGAIAAVLVWQLTPVLRSQAVPLLIVGPLVGLAMRFAGAGRHPVVGIASIVITIIAAYAGFVLGDFEIWTPPMLSEATRRFFSLTGVLVVALSCYVGWLIAARSA